jgi:hypothetical protein
MLLFIAYFYEWRQNFLVFFQKVIQCAVCRQRIEHKQIADAVFFYRRKFQRIVLALQEPGIEKITSFFMMPINYNKFFIFIPFFASQKSV